MLNATCGLTRQQLFPGIVAGPCLRVDQQGADQQDVRDNDTGDKEQAL